MLAKANVRREAKCRRTSASRLTMSSRVEVARYTQRCVVEGAPMPGALGYAAVLPSVCGAHSVGAR